MARKSNDNGKTPRPKNTDELFWLETYFIIFPQDRRPTLSQVERALSGANNRLRLENLAADEDGYFQSVLVESPEDHAAVEISYETGDAVIEQNLEWAKQLQKELKPQQLQQFVAADARLDVAHFERVQGGAAASKAGSTIDRETSGGKAGFHDDDDDPGDAEFDSDDEFDAEAAMDIFDPTCLLTVVEALSKLTRGLAFDPAAGEVV